jgi:hypothetical protein
VPTQAVDLPFHAPPPQPPREIALDGVLHERGQGVEHGTRAEHDDEHGEGATDAGQGTDLAVAHRGDGRHHHVEGIEEEPTFEEHIADGAEDHHAGDHGRRAGQQRDLRCDVGGRWRPSSSHGIDHPLRLRGPRTMGWAAAAVHVYHPRSALPVALLEVSAR